MKPFLFGATFFIAVLSSAFSQSTFLEPQRWWFSPLDAIAFRYGFGGWQNPAVLATHPGTEMIGSLSYPAQHHRFQQWAISLIAGNVSLTKIQTRYGDHLISDYGVATGIGNEEVALGISYRWGSGASATRSTPPRLNLGALLHPLPSLALGFSHTQALDTTLAQEHFSLAVRPFANPTATAFASYTVVSQQKFTDGFWRIGFLAEPFDGTRLYATWDATHQLQLGIQLSLTNGFGIQSTFGTDKSFNHRITSFAFRLGGYDRNLRDALFPPQQVYKYTFPQSVAYQTSQLFSKSVAWLSLLQHIERAAQDPNIRGIALNLDRFNLNHAMAWELRRSLQKFRHSGKKIFAYITRGSFPLLLVARVADFVIMDPYGMFLLPGYLAGHTYYKEFLDSLGIAIEEIRLFKYKSALEPLARSSMSEGEKEQLQALVNDWYQHTLQTLQQDGSLSFQQMDSLIDNAIMLSPQEAYRLGLIDTIGRFELLDSVAHHFLPQASVTETYNDRLQMLQNHDAYWQKPARIAVIYAIGICDMEEGIKARSLIKDVKAAVQDPSIKAIVLRVDSPGGDPLASDYIAEELRKAKGKKPVIISQGYVAGSGGYWLSMYGDTIVTTPYTLTGSIGVISGWFYDKGLSKKLHLHLDFVKKGKHSDLWYGYHLPLPLFNITIPHRPLQPEERQRFTAQIQELYQQFLDNVAAGRDTTTDYIHTIAQGRIWSGKRAQTVGLVDVLGSLTDAIAIAKEKAGIAAETPVEIIEYPKAPMVDLSSLFAPRRPISIRTTFYHYLHFRLQHNGEPLLLLPLNLTQLQMLQQLQYQP